MEQIEESDVFSIARGAAILGAGGGGDPWLGALMAQEAIKRFGPVRLVSPDALDDDDFVLPVAVMGAPTVIVEKAPSGNEFENAFAAMTRVQGKAVTHVGCLEVGGLNSMTPIVSAAYTGLPLVNGDGMGRAFPELQMVLFTVEGISCSPMAMADEKGNTILLDTIDNDWAERIARVATVELGCSATIALYPLTGRQARTAMIPHTLSLAYELGRLVENAREANEDPVAAVVDRMGGRVLGRGTTVDVQRRTVDGFAKGTAVIEGTDEFVGHSIELQFQNEHLVAMVDGVVAASVPDLICVFDVDTGEPVTTEAMRFGFRVAVAALPVNERWHHPDALALVGPRRFGYDHDYVPVTPAGVESLTSVNTKGKTGS